MYFCSCRLDFCGLGIQKDDVQKLFKQRSRLQGASFQAGSPRSSGASSWANCLFGRIGGLDCHRAVVLSALGRSVSAGTASPGTAQQSSAQPPAAQGQPQQQAPAQQPATTSPAADEGTFGSAPAANGSPAAPTVAPWMTVPPSDYHKHVASRYNYSFGKDTPFSAFERDVSKRRVFMSPEGLSERPRVVATAIRESYHQWRQSAHSNAFRAPWYLKNVNLLIEEKGVQFSRHCEGCHNPVALLSGDLSQGMPRKRPFEEEGVTCSTCHSMVSTTAMGTGSWVMGTPAVLVDENGQPITHPVSDGEILAHLDRHSKAVMRPVMHTSEFCAACHKAAIPRTLDDYKWLRAMTRMTSGNRAVSPKNRRCPSIARTWFRPAKPATW